MNKKTDSHKDKEVDTKQIDDIFAGLDTAPVAGAEPVTAEPQTLQVKKVQTTKKGGKFKGCLALFFVLVLCSTISAIVLVFGWYGGFITEKGCDIVLPNSSIGQKLNCDELSNDKVTTSGDDTYNYSVIEGDVSVTNQEEAIIDVVDSSVNSVVGIGITGGSSDERVIGTGFVITSNGLIITNQHVVSRDISDKFFVLFNDGSKLIAQNVYRDEVNDIAIIKVEATDLQVLPLGDSDELRVGQSVIAIGNPLGTLSSTVTVGTLSGLDRDVDIDSSNGFNFSSQTFSGVLQTDAAINPGNSGGPLLNTKGEVIGVNFATISGRDNLSFALPINRIKVRVDELNKYGDFRIPFLGVEYRRRVIFIKDQAVVAALVNNVVEKGPADLAGIKAGDAIVEFDGKNLEDNSLIALIQQTEVGSTVKIRIIRDGEPLTLDIEVGNRSDFASDSTGE